MAEIKTVDDETMQEITAYRQRAQALLALEGELAADAIVARINEFVRELKAEQRTPEEDDILALGILLGYQYVEGLSWHWGEAIWDGDEESAAIGVLSHDNSVFINTMYWMNEVLNSDRPTNFMLNYNMVKAGRMPPAQPGDAIGFY